MLNDVRQTQLIAWLNKVFSVENIELLVMSGDAGFRRYFRFYVNNQPYIAVDSPAQWCNNNAFICMQQSLDQANINVPQIIAQNDQVGFFCLSDLGDTLLSDIVNSDNMTMCYQQAIAILPKLSSLPCENLPHFDAQFIQTELNIFVEWLLNKHLAIVLSDQETYQLEQCFSVLTDNALAQPQVVMHRDYHSRNIMKAADDTLAIIDFQDAVYGPITYDIVSLLRDCYLKWPDDKVSELLSYFIKAQEKQYHYLTEVPAAQWQIWFDLMGLQRHIKASGIFARLHHRDNKSHYLRDIPLTLSYVVEVSRQYPSLLFLAQLVTEKVLPKLAMINAEETQL